MIKQEKLWRVLSLILNSLESLPETQKVTTQFDRTPRNYLGLSNAGKKPRFLAYEMKGMGSKQNKARSQFTMDIGHMVEEFLTEAINLGKVPEIKIKERNIEVQLTLPHPKGTVEIQPIMGHLDWILEVDGETWLIDCKSVDHNSFVFNDPINVAKNGQNPDNDNKYQDYFRFRIWKPRNYVFDCWEMYRGDIFKDSYIHQVEGYAWALEQKGITVDNTGILAASKNSGHLALGGLNLTKTQRKQIRSEITQNYLSAFSSPDPLTNPLCYDNIVGEEMAKACQYCRYMDHCFNYEVDFHPKGYPILTIQEIKK